MKRTPAAERLYQARRAAAKELKLPITAWQTKRLALLLVAFDSEQARAASGATINVDRVLQIDKAMAEIRSDIRASVPKPRLVQIALADWYVGICPHCKGRIEPYTPPALTPASDKPADTVHATDTVATPADKPNAPTNVTPLRTKADDYSITPRHDITQGFGGWLKQGGDQSWRDQQSSGGPDFSAAHPLPQIDGTKG